MPDRKFLLKEMLEEDHLYGLTLNVDKDFSDIKSDQRFALTYSYILMKLLELKNIFPNIRLYPEYARGSSNGQGKGLYPRLHLHGYSDVDLFRFYTYGVVKIDQHFIYHIQENTEDAEDYFKKNSTIMQKWCKEYGFPYEVTWESIEKCKLTIIQWYARTNGSSGTTKSIKKVRRT